MIRFIIELFLIYVAYKFITGFIIPLFFTVREVNRTMKQNTQPPRPSGTQNYTSSKTEPVNQKSNSPDDSEYIDFEEVK